MSALYEIDVSCTKCDAVLTAAGMHGPNPMAVNRFSFDCPFCNTPVEIATAGVEMALIRYQRPPAMFRRNLIHR